MVIRQGKGTSSIGREPIEQKFLSASTLESQSVLQHPRSTEPLESPEGIASESLSRLPPRLTTSRLTRLSVEEFHRILDTMAEGPERLPDLPAEGFSSESF